MYKTDDFYVDIMCCCGMLLTRACQNGQVHLPALRCTNV